jgi:hypothetical protein
MSDENFREQFQTDTFCHKNQYETVHEIFSQLVTLLKQGYTNVLSVKHNIWSHSYMIVNTIDKYAYCYINRGTTNQVRLNKTLTHK